MTFDVTQGLSAAGVGVFMADGGCLLASTTCLSTGRSASSAESGCLRLTAYPLPGRGLPACTWLQCTSRALRRWMPVAGQRLVARQRRRCIASSSTCPVSGGLSALVHGPVNGPKAHHSAVEGGHTSPQVWERALALCAFSLLPCLPHPSLHPAHKRHPCGSHSFVRVPCCRRAAREQ